MDLCVGNSGAKSGGELFKGSKDAASLLLCTRKNYLVGECGSKPQSESFFILNDLLGFRVQNLSSNVIKIFDQLAN